MERVNTVGKVLRGSKRVCVWGRKGHLHQQLWMERRVKPLRIICWRWIYLSAVFWGLIIFITTPISSTALRYQADIKGALSSRCPFARGLRNRIFSQWHAERMLLSSPESPSHKFLSTLLFICTLRSFWPFDDFRLSFPLNSHFLLLFSSQRSSFSSGGADPHPAISIHLPPRSCYLFIALMPLATCITSEFNSTCEFH